MRDFKEPFVNTLKPKTRASFMRHPSILLMGFVSITAALSINAYFIDNTKPVLSKKLDSRYQPTIPHDLSNYSPFQVLSFPEQLRTSKKTSTEQREMVAVQPGDNLSIIFSRLGLPKQVLHGILNLNGVEETISDLQPGQQILFLLNPDRTFKQLHYPINENNTLIISYRDGVFKTESLASESTKHYKFREGRIKTSFYEAASEEGLSDKTILQLAEIFRWDIDFALDLKKGDSFKILQEAFYQKGKKVREGPIVAAEFMNQGARYRAVRYVDKNGFSRYYTPQGTSLQKSFLRAPVQFAHISSHFTRARKHPILHKFRAHTGVDYAARTGTPIKAAGDGKIAFLGRRGGYGNTIVIQHDRQYSTLYAHLSRFSKEIKLGSEVYQGKIIGFVGSTGLTTGSHLHYEFLVNNIHRNPLTVALPNSSPIRDDEKNRFLKQSQFLLAELDKHGRTTVAMHQLQLP